MKKYFWILLMLLTPVAISAQVDGGTWKTHAKFAGTLVKNVIETGNKVYYLTNYDLFCFDKQTNENVSLNKSNDLNSLLVSGIYYNNDKKYLVITYDDSNIDIITDDGRKYNVPGIKNMVTTIANTINDVTFAPDKIYVATAFGFAVIDDTKFAISEWHRYNKSIESVAQMGDFIVLNALGDTKLSYCRVDALHDRLSQFSQTTTTISPGKFIPIDNERMFVSRTGNLSKITLSVDGDVLTTSTASLVAATPDNVQKTPTGYIANFLAQKYYYTFNATGDEPVKVTAAAEIYSSNADGDGSLWSVGANGLHNSKAASTYYKPEGLNISTIPFWMDYDHNSKLLYLSSTSDNQFLSSANVGAKCEINTYDGDRWTDITPTSGLPSVQGWYWPCVDPNNPSTYFIFTRTTSAAAGMLRITNGTVEANYCGNNSPFVARKGAIRFDKDGNLWVVHSSVPASNTTPIKVLPKDKLYLAPSMSNWTTYNLDAFATMANSFKYNNLVIGKGNDVKVFYGGDFQPVVIFDNHGDVTNSATWQGKSFFSVPAKNGGVVTWNYVRGNGADNDGNIWLAFDLGLVYFDPTKAFDDDFAVTDASSLVESQLVNDIAVDNENRKWIATNEAGVYVISADNSEVLHIFNTSNSGLATNCIYQVLCNPDNNSVFFTTPSGVFEYLLGAAPAPDNYDNVYAYPNPVKPDYTGLVTVTGLMENSNVVITDAAGTVVAQLIAASGTLTWDGCDAKGERLATGNYYIYASQGSVDLNASPVAKVMIIK